MSYETLEAIRVLGFWRTLWYMTGYRAFQRFAHRHNWHHMQVNLTGKATEQHWCMWCGIRVERNIVVTPGISKDPNWGRDLL